MKRMKIGYLGPQGTYTERALECWMPDAQKKPFTHLEAVFAATASKDVDLGFVPLENSIEGPVTQTFDCLLKYAGQLRIVDTAMLAIEHALGALPQRSAITRIFSKDTALAQCSEYLLANFPQAGLVPMQSTAKAIEVISSQQLFDAAAIGMESTLVKYGLQVVARNIGNKENERSNKTRFAVLGSQTQPASGNDVTTIVLYPHRDRIGLLEDAVNIISRKYQINMCSIHSRPDGRGLFRFYLDLEGHISQEGVQGCIANIKERLADTDVVFLGSYRHIPFNEKRISSIGIVGGTGKMGGWLARFFESVGYGVRTCGKDSEKSLEEAVCGSDVVIVNVPVEKTVEVVQQVGPRLHKGQLLVDNTGVKSSVVPAMLAVAPPDVEILSVHTMFGPNTPPTNASLLGENVISIHTVRSGKMADEFEAIFHKYGANITQATVEQHDSRMTIAQNLEHVCSVAYAATLLSIVPQVEKLLPFATPNLRRTLLTMGRIHAGDQQLYGVMLKENPRALDTLQYYQGVLEQIIDWLKKGDSCMFESIMSSNAQKLGKAFIEKQCNASNAIQELLKKE
ncbi:prephenate dehydrogenase/arogenate dehydrogenase family protein [Candidatus Woesearchaeota archaeon]|nr:prephenate dehydrogenase/arogenate dehydrogenase family protein [Candidatus Woesearchaeota archaeon]